MKKSVPGGVAGQGGRPSSQLQDTLKLPTHKTLARSVVDDPVATLGTTREPNSHILSAVSAGTLLYE